MRHISVFILTLLLFFFRIAVTRSKFCCGGTFYHKFGSKLSYNSTIATSPNYPNNYENDMRCPYVFKVTIYRPPIKKQFHLYVSDGLDIWRPPSLSELTPMLFIM